MTNGQEKSISTKGFNHSIYLNMGSVCVIKYSGKNKGKQLSSEKYQLLLEIGLKTLAGKQNIAESIRKFIPSGVVGMKVNCLTGKLNSTPKALTEGLSIILINAGIEQNDIIIWERTNRELEQAGFELNASSFGPRCLGTDTNNIGYSHEFYSAGEVDSLVSRVLTDLIDFNINLPILKDHSIAGLSAGLKNMYGAINNPNKFHDNNCDPFTADISNLEPIKLKNRFSIIDAIRVQYNGGPGYDSRYLSFYNGLIISDDPVAADAIGLEILEHLRKQNKLPTLKQNKREVKYLLSAEQRDLGIADKKLIDLKVIDIDDNGNQSEGKLI
ncbi:MAG: DUF362 domain-containing protein [candidate division Zixibacteria bacterium]|nr:DUF362 domain-containing protein [candidate division Zixibacteria bacterium]